MTALTVSEARKNFYQLVDQTAEHHEPVLIMGKRTNAILVSEEDWLSIQETLYLVSIPGMTKSIQEGIKTPASKMRKTLDW